MGRFGRPPRVRTVLHCGLREARKGEARLREANGERGESRGSGLWGAKRGGQGSSTGRKRGAVRRGLPLLLLLALAAPFAAGASHSSKHSDSYLAPSLKRAESQSPNASVPVIVQSDSDAGNAAFELDQYGTVDRQLGIADAAAGSIPADQLSQLAAQPGLVITPDLPVVLDANPHDSSSSSDLWTHAVGVDQLWPDTDRQRTKHDTVQRLTGPAPTIAFVDSGIEADRPDFAGRVLATENLSDLPDNSPGDGYGHGTFVAGLAAGSAPNYTGAAPTAGIVSLDVMDDSGMAQTSDVIRAAQWILQNRNRYNIRVANFSLHSASATSFRFDPLDKALEQLWFSGVVVVASAGNDGNGNKPVHMAYAPANDPFFISVGALDLHNSTNPERADVPPWSSWGYTLDGFAKPELSAPGRSLPGPVPAGSTLATSKKLAGQVRQTPGGTYMVLSGTSLSTPIVSGIADDLLALNPSLTPDRVKGALMLGAQPLRKVRSLAAGVGEVNAPLADNAALGFAPNPNRALDMFLATDPQTGATYFDDAAWKAAILSSPLWDSVSWRDGWAGAVWSVVSWASVSWSDVSWSDVSWSDVSWSDVSWTDLWNVYADVNDDGP
jgi:serine protease AprX